MATHDQRFDSNIHGEVQSTIHTTAELCGGRLKDASISTSRQGGAATVKATCEKCGTKVEYCSSSKVCDADGVSRTDIGLRLMTSSFLVGSTFTQTSRLLDTIGVEHYGSDAFVDINQTLVKVLRDVTDKSMEVALEEVRKSHGDKLVIAVDFTWDSRNSGKAGTLTVTSPITKKSLLRFHILRTGQFQNFVGSSKAMEGAAVKLLCEELVKRALKLKAVVHDKDSSTFSQLSKQFRPPYQDEIVQDWQDIGHASKNLRQRIDEKAKSFKQLDTLGEKVRVFFSKSPACGFPRKTRGQTKRRRWCSKKPCGMWQITIVAFTKKCSVADLSKGR